MMKLRYAYNDPERHRLYLIDLYQRRLKKCLYHADNEEANYILIKLKELEGK